MLLSVEKSVPLPRQAEEKGEEEGSSGHLAEPSYNAKAAPARAVGGLGVLGLNAGLLKELSVPVQAPAASAGEGAVHQPAPPQEAEEGAVGQAQGAGDGLGVVKEEQAEAESY